MEVAEQGSCEGHQEIFEKILIYPFTSLDLSLIM